MLEARGCPDLSLEVLQKFLVTMRHLDCDFPRHVQVERAIHNTHATLTNNANYLVPAYLGDGGLRQNFTSIDKAKFSR
jgi:hypothetical protein